MAKNELDAYDESNINVTFEVLFRAETLKIFKFSPEIFLIPIIIW